MKRPAELLKIESEYNDNVARNAHTENALLLAQNFGRELDVKEVEIILANRDRRGYLSSFDSDRISQMIPPWQRAFRRQLAAI